MYESDKCPLEFFMYFGHSIIEDPVHVHVGLNLNQYWMSWDETLHARLHFDFATPSPDGLVRMKQQNAKS